MQCQAILSSGQPCGGFAIEGSQFCFTHDPDRSAERAEARSKGGRTHADRVLALDPERRRARIQELTDAGVKGGRMALLGALADVEALENSVARARTIAHLIAVLYKLNLLEKRDNYYDEDDDDDWPDFLKGASSSQSPGRTP